MCRHIFESELPIMCACVDCRVDATRDEFQAFPGPPKSDRRVLRSCNFLPVETNSRPRRQICARQTLSEGYNEISVLLFIIIFFFFLREEALRNYLLEKVFTQRNPPTLHAERGKTISYREGESTPVSYPLLTEVGYFVTYTFKEYGSET